MPSYMPYTPTAPLNFDDILETVKTGFSNVVRVVDAGLDFYAAVPGRLEALKEISEDVKKVSLQDVIDEANKPTKTVSDKTKTWFEYNSGALTIGIVAVLVAVAIEVS